MRPSTQILKTSQQSRSKRQIKQVPKKITSSITYIESIRKIQRWWRSIKISKFSKPKKYFPSSYNTKAPFDFEDSFIQNPQKSTLEESLNLNSSIQSRTAELLQYLESSDKKTKPIIDDSHSFISQAALLNYRLELEEALKTIDSLKVVIQRLKKEAISKEEENKKIVDLALDRQRNEYEEIGLKNVSFIEQLLTEKQQRIGQLTELTQKIREMETRHQKTIHELKEKFEKEMKKQKDAWVTSEKNKRNSWMKEKTKEIKENTTKGLEPEIMRILADNKRNLEKLRDEQELEMKRYKQQIDQESDLRLQDLKEELKRKYDETLEKERENYQERLRDLHIKQEEELLNMRKKWTDDLAAEKQKIHDLRVREENSNLSKLKSIQTEYTEKIEDLIKKHENTLEELQHKHENKLKKMKQDLAYEKEEWLNSQVIRLNKEIEEKKEAIKTDLIQNRDKELKSIIAKLSEEKVVYKKKLDKEVEGKLKILQDKHDAELMDYEKLVESFKEKIDKTTSARKNLNENFQTLGKKIQDQELLISKLESEKLALKEQIIELQVKIEGYKEGQGDQIEEVRKDERKKAALIQQELDITKEQIELMKEKYEEKLSQIAQKEAEEFEAIESRVKTTITKKDEKIREIMQELQISRLKITKLEELLEKQRRNLMQI